MEKIVEKVVYSKEIVEVPKIVEKVVYQDKIVEVEKIKEVEVIKEVIKEIVKTVEVPVESVKVELVEKIIEKIIYEKVAGGGGGGAEEDCDCLTGARLINVWNKMFKISGPSTTECLTEEQFVSVLAKSFTANF